LSRVASQRGRRLVKAEVCSQESLLPCSTQLHSNERNRKQPLFFLANDMNNDNNGNGGGFETEVSVVERLCVSVDGHRACLLATRPVCWPPSPYGGHRARVLATEPVCWPPRCGGRRARVLAREPVCWPPSPCVGQRARMSATEPVCGKARVLAKEPGCWRKKPVCWRRSPGVGGKST